jgi:hypothetical protein
MNGPSGFRGHSRKMNRFLPVWAVSDSGALYRSRIAWLESSNGDFVGIPLSASCLLDTRLVTFTMRQAVDRRNLSSVDGMVTSLT